MESGGVVCFGGCITQYTDFRGVALVYDTYRDSSVGGAGEKCLTTTFGDSEHVAANTDFVVFNGLFDCLSFNNQGDCEGDNLCSWENNKCIVTSTIISKGLGNVANSGWGNGAKRHVFNIYVRSTDGTTASAGSTGGEGASAAGSDCSCQNGGVCIKKEGALEERCECPPSFAGQDCSVHRKEIQAHQNVAIYAGVVLGNTGSITSQLTDGRKDTCVSIDHATDTSKRWSRVDLSTTRTITSMVVAFQTESGTDPEYEKGMYEIWLGNNGARHDKRNIHCRVDRIFDESGKTRNGYTQADITMVEFSCEQDMDSVRGRYLWLVRTRDSTMSTTPKVCEIAVKSEETVISQAVKNDRPMHYFAFSRHRESAASLYDHGTEGAESSEHLMALSGGSWFAKGIVGTTGLHCNGVDGYVVQVSVVVMFLVFDVLEKVI